MSTLSAAASAWLGRRGRRVVGDASGEPVGEGRGSPVCAQPAVPALSSLAAGLHHHHEHGPAAVRGQRGEACLSSLSLSSYLMPTLSSATASSSSSCFHSVSQLLANILPTMHFSLPPQIYYYADSIYATAGVKQNDIQYVTVGTGAVNVFMTIAAVGTPFIRSLKS